jgi:hypothetical protein
MGRGQAVRKRILIPLFPGCPVSPSTIKYQSEIKMTPGLQPGKSYPDTIDLAGFMKERRQMQLNRFL